MVKVDALLKEINGLIAMADYGIEHRTDWYVGVTDNVDRQLFSVHKVNAIAQEYYWFELDLPLYAAIIAIKLSEQSNIHGGPGVISDNSKSIYVYRIEPNNVQELDRDRFLAGELENFELAIG